MKHGFRLAELGFFSIWLLGWTLGVAFIQYLTLTEPFSMTSVFLFTHGGAEVLVLTLLGQRIASAAELATVSPVLQRDHAGLSATWPVGTGSLVMLAVGSLLGVVTHVGLVAPLFLALATPSVGSVLLSCGLLAVWGFTGFRWARAVWRHVEARQEVVLEADFDAVTVRQGAETTTLPMLGLSVGMGLEDELVLMSGDASWMGFVAEGPVRAELMDALRVMAERATPMDEVRQPEAMRRLRGTAST